MAVTVPRRAALCGVTLLLVLLSVEGRELRRVRNRVTNNDSSSAVTIPDTGAIDSDLLKAANADKFLSLWFIFVLAGPTKFTDKPWTLLVPENTGLPGPGMHGFLTSKDNTKSLLLNHVILEQSIDTEAPPTNTVTTLMGTPLTFTKSSDGLFVNGIKVLVNKLSTNGGTVLVLESYIPIEQATESVTTKTETTAAATTRKSTTEKIEEPTTVSTESASIAQTTQSSTTLANEIKLEVSTEKSPRIKVRPSPLFRSSRNKPRTSSGENTRKLSSPPASTRFDKFKRLAEEKAAAARLAREKSILSNITQNAITSTTQNSVTLPSIASTTDKAQEETTPFEITSDAEEVTENLTETTTEEVTTTTTSSPTTTTTSSSTTTPDIFALFSAMIASSSSKTPSTTEATTTTEPSITEVTPDTSEKRLKEDSIMVAFQEFVKSTEGKETTPSLVFVNFEMTENPSHGKDEDATGIDAEFPIEVFEEATHVERSTGELHKASEMLVEMSSDSSDNDFLSWIKNELTNTKRIGGKEFMNHLLKSGVAQQLVSDRKYTALIPTDEAFYAYYPIDWGFNIFSVKSFLVRTLQEHLLEGDIPLENLPDGSILTTLAGTTLTVNKSPEGLTVSGLKVIKESEITSSYGRLYSLPGILHVNSQTVKQLRDMNPHLERAPLLGSPWPMSQFLSHLYQRTIGESSPSSPSSAHDSTTLFAKYLAMSHLSHLAPSSDDDMNHLEYTALVPNDYSITLSLAQLSSSKRSEPVNSVKIESENLLLEDADLRNQFVGSHILQGRYRITDLTPGATVKTLLNDTLSVTQLPDGGIAVGGAKLTSAGTSIYNLGAMFTVEGPLILGAKTNEREIIIAETEAPPLVVTRTEVSVSKRVNNGAQETVALPLSRLP